MVHQERAKEKEVRKQRLDKLKAELEGFDERAPLLTLYVVEVDTASADSANAQRERGSLLDSDDDEADADAESHAKAAELTSEAAALSQDCGAQFAQLRVADGESAMTMRRRLLIDVVADRLAPSLQRRYRRARRREQLAVINAKRQRIAQAVADMYSPRALALTASTDSLASDLGDDEANDRRLRR